MSLSSEIFGRLVPLYFFVAAGFIGTRILKLPREPLSTFLIYLVAPVMIFASLLKIPLQKETLFFPLLYFGISSGLGLLSFKGARFFRGPTLNLFAFGAGNANTGYFGIPVTLALAGPAAADLAVLVVLGLVAYENTVGVYITSRAHHSARLAVRQIFRLPVLYAAALAVAWRLLGLPEGSWIFSVGDSARTTYSVMGFTIIGLGFGAVSRAHFDWRYLVSAQAAKFILWPLATAGILFLFQATGLSLSTDGRAVMGIMAFVPMAANTVVFATLLRAEPEKAAVAVFVSTLLSLALFSAGASHWLLPN